MGIQPITISSVTKTKFAVGGSVVIRERGEAGSERFFVTGNRDSRVETLNRTELEDLVAISLKALDES